MTYLRIASLLFLLSLPAAAWADAPAATNAGDAPRQTASDTVNGTTPQALADTPLTASLTQSVAPDGPIDTGQTVQLTLAVTHPPGADVQFPEAFEPARWSLIDVAQQPNPQGEGNATSKWVLTFGIYRPGTTTLEPFGVTIRTKDGRSTTLTTEPVDAKVVSVLADLDTAPEFKAPRPAVPVWVEDYTLAWLGGGLGVFALFGLLAFWAQRRKALAPPPPAPPRKPHEIALEKLAALAADDLVERGEYMVFWVRLSETVREYFGRTYGFPPTELTTTEVLDNLLDVKWPNGVDLTDVRRFLRRCDEVKFGGVVPTAEESSEMLRKGFTFVELTRPVTAPEEPGAVAASLTDATSDAEGSADPGEDPGEEDADARWKPPTDEPHDDARAEEEE